MHNLPIGLFLLIFNEIHPHISPSSHACKISESTIWQEKSCYINSNPISGLVVNLGLLAQRTNKPT